MKMSDQCTCTKDAEITCIVHPTERALKQRIDELEDWNSAYCVREAEYVNRIDALTNELEDTVTECMAEKSNNDILQARIDALTKQEYAALEALGNERKRLYALEKAARDVMEGYEAYAARKSRLVPGVW